MIAAASEWLLQRLLKGADYVIAVSMFLVNYVQRIGIDNVELITNGADLGIFKPNLDPEGLASSFTKRLEGSKIIGVVGTMDRWLDFSTVLASLKELSTKMDVKLLVVGGKMVTDFFDETKAEVKRIGLQDQVVFTGVVPHRDVPYYVNLMDVCLIPMRPELRLNQARCPDKLFEYLACGKPVVSTRISEVLRLGGDAVRTYDDVSSLTNTLDTVLFDEDLQASMEKAALDIAKDYDWQVIARRYRRTLEEVMGD
jgi:glycosyltransferase involved in cell wall biosynthesis